MFCPKCGQELIPQTRFCAHSGVVRDGDSVPLYSIDISIMIALQVATGKDSLETLYTVCAVIFSGLFICFEHALPNYIEKTVSEKLLNGISVPKYIVVLPSGQNKIAQSFGSAH